MAHPVVFFQGQRGAYSEEAASVIFPGATMVAQPTFRKVFEALAAQPEAFACLPIENTTAGRVSDVQLLLPRFGFQIIKEHFLPVRHQLLGVVGGSLSRVREVLSHPQALAQCERFLKEHNLTPIPFEDTAGAAAEVARRNDPTLAAIASRAAQRHYRLKAFAEDIQDETHNTTRFIVLAGSSQPIEPPDPSRAFITAIWFTLKSVPAALYKAIGGFATAALNLTKIESHLTGHRFTRAQFYIEVEGHPETDAMRHAMRELTFFADDVRVLGVFPADPYRYNGHPQEIVL